MKIENCELKIVLHKVPKLIYDCCAGGVVVRLVRLCRDCCAITPS